MIISVLFCYPKFIVYFCGCFPGFLFFLGTS